jgi:LacI family transcriptional regulator, galactose operon repressor
MNKGVRELAKATGYSVATISRVLNGSSAVKKETREHVLAIARKLNFFPNPMARAFATRRTRVIGAIIPTIEHSIFATFMRTMEETLAEKDFTLVLAITNFDEALEKERAFQLMNMGAEALVVSGLEHDAEMLSVAAARKVPIVCTDIHKPDAPLPTIGYDNYGLGRQAAQYLRDLGHKRIAVLHGGSATNDRTRLRIKGVRSVFDLKMAPLFIETPLSVTGGVEAMRKLFSSIPVPSAILCLSDVLALGVFLEAQRLKLDIPSEISIMGFDDLEWARAVYPAMTTIRLPVAEMGRATAEALIGYLDNKAELVSQLLDGDLMVRDSTC